MGILLLQIWKMMLFMERLYIGRTHPGLLFAEPVTQDCNICALMGVSRRTNSQSLRLLRRPRARGSRLQRLASSPCMARPCPHHACTGRTWEEAIFPCPSRLCWWQKTQTQFNKQKGSDSSSTWQVWGYDHLVPQLRQGSAGVTRSGPSPGRLSFTVKGRAAAPGLKPSQLRANGHTLLLCPAQAPCLFLLWVDPSHIATTAAWLRDILKDPYPQVRVRKVLLCRGDGRSATWRRINGCKQQNQVDTWSSFICS